MYLARFQSVPAALLLTACATAYQPFGPTGGYKERELEPGKYELYFLGNGLTSAQEVERYWHKRAAELCKSGYKHSYSDEKTFTARNYVPAAGAIVPIAVSTPQLLGIIECK